MTTRSLFQNLAVTVFDIFDDITLQRTYREYSAATYSLATGKATQGYTDYPVKMLFSEINEQKDDFADVLSKDQKVTIPTQLSQFTPKQGDKVYDGTTAYQVVEIKEDPADALWILQVRQTNG